MSIQNQSQKHQDFTKYDEQGAYHWKQMRWNMKRFNAGLSARYEMAEQMLRECFSGLSVNRVLDIGCGDGYFTNVVARMFPDAEVHGFDFSETGIKFAKQISQQRNVNFFVGDAFSSSGLYDLIVMTDVIEHVPNAGEILQSCREKLTKNGAIFISTPIRIKEIPDDPFHVHEFFHNELEKLVNESGFSCLSHTVSHDYTVLLKYGRRYSLMGLGKMRLGKYAANIRAYWFKKNPFSRSLRDLPTMQYLAAKKN